MVLASAWDTPRVARSNAAVDAAPWLLATPRVSISPARWTCTVNTNRARISTCCATTNKSRSATFQNSESRNPVNPARTASNPAETVAVTSGPDI